MLWSGGCYCILPVEGKGEWKGGGASRRFGGGMGVYFTVWRVVAVGLVIWGKRRVRYEENVCTES